MTLTELLICGLATWQVVEIWQHGSILASWKATTQAWMTQPWRWLSALLNCPFCLSVWVGLVFTALACIANATESGWVLWPAYPFAVSRLANVCNDLTWSYCRTPGRGDLKTSLENSEGHHVSTATSAGEPGPAAVKFSELDGTHL